jgi:double-stranded uracil-DNA glycosylase
MLVIESFPAIAAAECHTLILGTMPGAVSLAQHRYYAHPRNAFWPIMTELLALDADSDYLAKTTALAAHGFALWDVLKACVREGSLDTAIENDSIVPNDVAGFLNRHRSVRRICFNGATAAKLFRRHIQPTLPTPTSIDYLQLPSTSPAHAGMRYEQKLNIWRTLLDPHNSRLIIKK